MTQRKEQLWNECQRLARETAHRSGIGDPYHEADKVLTPEDKEEIKALWNTMPGSTCWADAFLNWLNQP